MGTFLKVFTLFMSLEPEVRALVVAVLAAIHSSPADHQAAVSSAVATVVAKQPGA